MSRPTRAAARAIPVAPPRAHWSAAIAAISALLWLHGCGSDFAPSPVRAATPSSDEAPAAGSSLSPLCSPAPVLCDAAPPECEPGEIPEAEPCPMGHCPDRCWTGRCVTCGTHCQSDDECQLVGRHGCCGDAGDCAEGDSGDGRARLSHGLHARSSVPRLSPLRTPLGALRSRLVRQRLDPLRARLPLRLTGRSRIHPPIGSVSRGTSLRAQGMHTPPSQ
jgi:hypothetical protein